MHLEDRKRNQGQNVPWGRGDTPDKEVLLLVKKNKDRIPCHIEFEYNAPEGSTTVAEFKKCFAFRRQALA